MERDLTWRSHPVKSKSEKIGHPGPVCSITELLLSNRQLLIVQRYTEKNRFFFGMTSIGLGKQEAWVVGSDQPAATYWSRMASAIFGKRKD